MRLLYFTVFFTFTFTASSQVSINTVGTPPDPSSVLDLSDPAKGLLIPRLTLLQRNSITLPANALLIYQTDNDPGFYYNQGTPLAPEWVNLSSMTDIIHLEDRIPIDSLPYDITAPGSYYVTAHLSGIAGIGIYVSNVTLDLNGYSVKGLAGNNSEGIEVFALSTSICIRNGSVVEWEKEGIKATLASNSSFSDLHLVANAYDGLSAGSNNLVSNVVASDNGFDGIDMGESASVFHCTASNNTNEGIEADMGSSLIQCTANGNQQIGIRLFGACSATNCSSVENNNHGFSCGAGSVLRQNVSTDNSKSGFYLFSSVVASENTARVNGHHGFEFQNDCQLTFNQATLNVLSGFNTTFNGGKLENNSSFSNVQHGFNIQNTGGCLIIRNSAGGNGINPFNILPGNTFASPVTAATINTNTNPFANFQL